MWLVIDNMTTQYEGHYCCGVVTYPTYWGGDPKYPAQDFLCVDFFYTSE